MHIHIYDYFLTITRFVWIFRLEHINQSPFNRIAILKRTCLELFWLSSMNVSIVFFYKNWPKKSDQLFFLKIDQCVVLSVNTFSLFYQ